MAKRIIIAAILLIAMPASAREQLRIVGSSTVFPFVAAAAEQFGRKGEFRTPIVEATGTGGGIKMFCNGVGMDYPDMANASRTIKDSEVELCAKHGVKVITELKIGYDGIVLANARASESYALTRRSLFLALAREVPKDGKWVENPYKAAGGADLVVMLTEWNEFRGLDLVKLARKMATPVMADLRNVYDRQEVLDAGFARYVGVGR